MTQARNSMQPPRKKLKPNRNARPSLSFLDAEEMPAGSPEQHYQMSNSTRFPLILSKWLGENEDDPALEVRTYIFR